jgi:hypothetical protein
MTPWEPQKIRLFFEVPFFGKKTTCPGAWIAPSNQHAARQGAQTQFSRKHGSRANTVCGGV